MDRTQIKSVLEGVLLVAGKPMSIEQLERIFDEDDNHPPRSMLRELLDELQTECEGRALELKEVASGFRYQVRDELAIWVGRLWEEKPPRYSRALLETLALVAYRQPITRAEIEDIRGVSVSSHIVKTLLEREWVRVVGHREVPGRPALYGTTRQFLDYFNLKTLDELPTLAELRDLDELHPELALENPDQPVAAAEDDAVTNESESEVIEEVQANNETPEVESSVDEPEEDITSDEPEGQEDQILH